MFKKLKKFWNSFSNEPQYKDKLETGNKKNAGNLTHLPDEEEMFKIWKTIEEIIAHPSSSNNLLTEVLAAASNITNISCLVLTFISPSDNKNYYPIASTGIDLEELPSALPIDLGLAGWIHSKEKPLLLPQFQGKSEKSYIFTKDEPLKDITAFHGWPIFYQNGLRGSLLALALNNENILPQQITFFECLSLRLASQLYQDHLINRVIELKKLDNQTGLPHRNYFLERVNKMIDLSTVKNDGISIFVLGTVGLGNFSEKQGQKVSQELLYAIAQQFLNLTKKNWELGHISYGVFTLACPASEAKEAESYLNSFKEKLKDWPLINVSGRVNLNYFESQVSFPQDGQKAEILLEKALKKLIEV